MFFQPLHEAISMLEQAATCCLDVGHGTAGAPVVAIAQIRPPFPSVPAAPDRGSFRKPAIYRFKGLQNPSRTEFPPVVQSQAQTRANILRASIIRTRGLC